MAGNAMAEVPGGLCGLTALRSLLMSVNQLVTLPPDMSRLVSLTHLDVSLNHLTSLGTLPPALVRLSAQTNSLAELPSDLPQLLGGSLQWLDVSNNALERLPKRLHRLKKLHTLRLSFNQLQSLPCGELAGIPELHRLEAYYACRIKVASDCVAHDRALQKLRRRRPMLSVGFMSAPAAAPVSAV
uniref:Uncharacterized protein n=1 Tax=Chlamydomonas euryale TaxID=1486919 RepID=A0A7R9V4Y3_9CHLO